MDDELFMTENYNITITSKSPKYDKIESICHHCKTPITQNSMVMVEDRGNKILWHEDCFNCDSCSLNMAFHETCLFKDNSKLYCEEDYIKSLEFSCKNCKSIINKCDYAIKYDDYFYHEDCFVCKICLYKPNVGERFYFRDGDLLCPEHSKINDFSKNYMKQLETISCGVDHIFKQDNFNPTKNKENDKRMRNRKHKSSRVRTVLTEAQLEALNNYYDANPRPDAVMKERLVELTGLNPRVIRVWFQNKRCKEKKTQSYEDGKQPQFFHGNWNPHFSTLGSRFRTSSSNNPFHS